MSRTKIVATIGPKTDNPAALRKLAAAGLDIARLNGSHADLDWHAHTIELIHEALPEVPILHILGVTETDPPRVHLAP